MVTARAGDRPDRPDRPGGQGVVLVVEHEAAVADLQRLYLARAGYDVQVVAEPGRAAAAAAQWRPVAVVLDLCAPGTDAEDLYAVVAAAAKPAPVVCVVAAETGPPRVARGPRPAAEGVGAAGEVAHVIRPFSPRALVAAVDAVLRQRPVETPLPHVLAAGALTVDPVARTVRSAGHRVELTATEFDLLVFMMRHPGRVYSREQLLATVWPAPNAAGSRTVDVHIAQLRGKLGPASPIRTVRGVGYAADID